MQESLYYKPGGAVPQPDPSSAGLPSAPFSTGLPENTGIFGGVDWASSGPAPVAQDQYLQQDAVDNTAVGRISIPA